MSPASGLAGEADLDLRQRGLAGPEDGQTEPLHEHDPVRGRRLLDRAGVQHLGFAPALRPIGEGHFACRVIGGERKRERRDDRIAHGGRGRLELHGNRGLHGGRGRERQAVDCAGAAGDGERKAEHEGVGEGGTAGARQRSHRRSLLRRDSKNATSSGMIGAVGGAASR